MLPIIGSEIERKRATEWYIPPEAPSSDNLSLTYHRNVNSYTAYTFALDARRPHRHRLRFIVTREGKLITMASSVLSSRKFKRILMNSALIPWIVIDVLLVCSSRCRVERPSRASLVVGRVFDVTVRRRRRFRRGQAIEIYVRQDLGSQLVPCVADSSPT